MSDHREDNEKSKDRIRSLVGHGTELAGGAVGGAIGLLAGDVAGAALLGAGGTLIGSALRHIGDEISQRLLGPREKVRVGAVIALAASEINQRLTNGEQLRADDFFQEKAAGRSDAEEVAESIVLKAQREPQEQKLPYMAHLLSNIAFQSEISTAMAHQLIKAAETLTYRQLCILKLAVVKEAFPLNKDAYRDRDSFPRELYQILYECFDLYARGFLNFGGDVAFGLTDVRPASMTAQGLGEDLYNLMKLAEIPNEHLISIAAQLK